MSDDSAFQDLIARLRDGDETAAQEIYHRFADQVIGVARRHLGSLVLRKVDPEDIAQSAYRTTLRRLRDGRLEAETWDRLWLLLFTITVNKCRKQSERFLTQRRDPRREVPINSSATASGYGWEPAGREETPLEALVLLETVEEMLRGLSDPRHRAIIELRLQDMTQSEISQQVGVSERTVQRVLERVQSRLQEWLQTP